MVRCKKCGRRTEEKSFCIFCGNPLKVDSDELFVKKRKKMKERSVIYAATSVFLVVGIGIFLYFAFFI